MKIADNIMGTQPPWGTFISAEDKYMTSMEPNNRRNGMAKGPFFQTKVMTSAIRQLVINITDIQASPRNEKSEVIMIHRRLCNWIILKRNEAKSNRISLNE